MLRRSLPTETRAVRRRLGNAIACVLLFCTAAALIWDLRDTHFPSAAEITSRRVIVLQTEDGRDLLTKGSFRLAPIAAKDMPVDVINAIVSIEDRHFYRHGGIEVPSMLRALGGNIKAGHIVAGGSTITQQLVKVLFLGPQRTYARKIQEAVLARWLEYHLTKDEILTSYLNNVYLGSGAIGFPAAAKLYFGKKVADLNLAEAATLAGMINSPTAADPFHNLAAARYRAGIVLNAMVANEKLSQDETLVAKLNPATVNPVRAGSPIGSTRKWPELSLPRAAPCASARRSMCICKS